MNFYLLQSYNFLNFLNTANIMLRSIKSALVENPAKLNLVKDLDFKI